jgi:hypothetical protein
VRWATIGANNLLLHGLIVGRKSKKILVYSLNSFQKLKKFMRHEQTHSTHIQPFPLYPSANAARILPRHRGGGRGGGGWKVLHYVTLVDTRHYVVYYHIT